MNTKKMWPGDEDGVEQENANADATLSEQAAARDEGKTRAGDSLRATQVRHEAFDHVNKEWLTKCPTFEQMLKDAREFQATCKDIDGAHEADLKVVGGKLVVGDQGAFAISERAVRNLADRCDVPAAYLRKLQDVDVELFDLNAQRGLDRMTKGGEGKALFLRTRQTGEGGVMRAILSDQYATINNLPIIETLADVVPGGRVSHLGYDGDTFRANILIPETLRRESDSDYGGGIGVLNNETGRFTYRQRPFVFRHICCNGNVWDRMDGAEFSQRHQGDIVWAAFRRMIVENIQRQIPLVNENINKVLALKGIPVAQSEIQKAIVYISHREALANKHAQGWAEGFKTELVNASTGKEILSAFGIVQGLTRAAQKVGMDLQEQMETLSARLIDGNWDRLLTSARTVTSEEVEKVLALK